LFRVLAGIDTLNEETDNYLALGTFDQYLYVKNKERMIGWGLFARFAFCPDDRNVIDQFYSFGVGGRGCLIPACRSTSDRRRMAGKTYKFIMSAKVSVKQLRSLIIYDPTPWRSISRVS
jgi:hypothetical protein